MPVEGFDTLLWDALLNVEQHREIVRLRVRHAEEQETLLGYQRLEMDRITGEWPSDAAWDATYKRFYAGRGF